MFNGIVYNTGITQYIKKNKKDYFFGIHTSLNFSKKDIGSSIACDGVCLTLVDIRKKVIFFYISQETLKRSNLKFLKIGKSINIEKSLIFGQKISGHFSQGHIDTTAFVRKISIKGKTWLVNFVIKDKRYIKFIVEKASISINGVSLTISKVGKDFFEINIIPHTLKLTNLKKLKIKDIVNIELDIFSKYIKKVLS